MQFTDEGYIINTKKHGESSLLLTVLTREHGKLTGFARHCLSRKTLPIYQLGNLIKVDAYARVEENMPSLRVELVSPLSVNFIADSKKLAALSALCSLCNACLPEKEPLESFYKTVDNFFNLTHEDNWITHYSYFEYYLLEYLGVGLDLSECSATGSRDNLAYISPKTAKAVSAAAASGYESRLFAFPKYIVDKNYHPEPKEVADLLAMTEFFLDRNFFKTHNLKFPVNRASLCDKLNIK